MASLVRQLRLDSAFAARPDQTARRFTLIVPTNSAWEKAQLDFSKAYNTLVEGQFPNYVSPFQYQVIEKVPGTGTTEFPIPSCREVFVLFVGSFPGLWAATAANYCPSRGG